MVEKEQIKESLQNIINNIEEFDRGDIDWYYEQVTFSDEDEDEEDDYRSMDQRLMTEAFKYPELHPLMREVVEAIIQTNANVGEVWDQDEEHAGTNAALLLALENRDDVLLYANFIATNDLNHPVYQEEDWEEVFEKWGECEETLLLLITIALVPGQWFHIEEYWENFTGFIKKDGNINLFLKQLHFFILKVNEMDLPCRSVEDFLNEKMPELLPDEITGDEEMVKHIVNQFLEYPEVPEPPTLDMLKEGYEG